MRPALRVLQPGMLTTVQDLGRPGHQSLGIPVSGALDSLSLRAANALVGNAPDAGALEVAYVGPTLAVDADEVRLAFAGADAAIDVFPDETSTSGTRIGTMRSIRLRRGEVVRIGSLIGGVVLYVAVEGGFDIAPVLGSVSTYIRGGFGGFQGRALRENDLIPLVRDTASDQDYQLVGLDLGVPAQFRVIPDRRTIASPSRQSRISSAPNTASAPVPTAQACGSTVCGSDICTDSISPPTPLHPARSRCQAAACRSCFWRIARRPAAIQRSPPSFQPTFPRSAAFRSAQRFRSLR